jgi:dTDP-glucose pyrophosphorylase
VTPIHHQRQEKELPDLIQCAIDDGKLVKSFFVCDKYANINSTDDIEFAESFFTDEALVTA